MSFNAICTTVDKIFEKENKSKQKYLINRIESNRIESTYQTHSEIYGTLSLYIVHIFPVISRSQKDSLDVCVGGYGKLLHVDPRRST